MAEEGKITLNVSRDELEERIDAVPIIKRDMANILKNFPDNKKEEALKNISDTVTECQETVGKYQTKIDNANTTSIKNQTAITGLRTDLTDTDKKIGILRGQVFGSDPIGTETIVARINGKVNNSTYSVFTKQTEDNFSGINKQIEELKTKDSNLQDGIKNNGTQIESIKKTLNGDGTESNPGLINLGKKISALETNIQQNETSISTISKKINEIIARLEVIEQQLGIPNQQKK